MSSRPKSEPDTLNETIPQGRVALTITETARATTFSRPTIYEEIRAKRLRTAVVGRRRVVPIEELRRWLAAQTIDGEGDHEHEHPRREPRERNAASCEWPHRQWRHRPVSILRAATHAAVDSKAEVDRLAALDPFDYERERTAAADRLQVRVSKLDEAVGLRRKQVCPTPSTAGGGSPLELLATDPWPEPVDGNVLADEATTAIERHCVLPEGGAVAMMLWSKLAHGFDLFDHSPRLGFNSPEKRCGKTTALAIVGELVPRALSTANITPAALFRAVELAQPTLLIDEADTFLNGKDELRGILNSGHSRTSGFVVRTVGEDFEPRRFNTHCPACIAMIGKPPATLADRSILIPMRRKAVSEHAQRLRRQDRAYLNQLARKMARWIEDHRIALQAADPVIPDRLNDRAADNWRPLLAIADALGGEWPQRARHAALLLARSAAADDDDIGTALLADIRALFDWAGEDRLPSRRMLDKLIEHEEGPWADLLKGRALTLPHLARLLKPFGVRPRTIRYGAETVKGYTRADFEDAFARYLPPQPVTPSQASKDAA